MRSSWQQLIILLSNQSQQGNNYTEAREKSCGKTNAGRIHESYKEQEEFRSTTSFCPYSGSSEWLRFDVVHPAVSAENMTAITDPTFRRTWCGFFEPVFWDATGFLPELKDNTAVYEVSPQWFTKKRYDSCQQFLIATS